MLKKYFQLDTRIVLAAILIIELVYSIISSYYILDGRILYNSLIQELTVAEIQDIADKGRTNAWAMVALSPLNVLVQMVLVTLAISVGVLMLRYPIRFAQIFSVVVKAFAVFAVARLFFLIGCMYFGVKNLGDLDYTSKLSLYEWIGSTALPPWTIFPLQLINVFQISFVLLLALGLNYLQQHGLRRWLPLVLGTYGTGVAICIILFLFITFM